MVRSKTIRGYLVVRANGEMRVLKTRSQLRLKNDEVAFPLIVSIPETWGNVQDSKLHVELPDAPAATVTVSDEMVTPEIEVDPDDPLAVLLVDDEGDDAAE